MFFGVLPATNDVLEGTTSCLYFLNHLRDVPVGCPGSNIHADYRGGSEKIAETTVGRGILFRDRFREFLVQLISRGSRREPGKTSTGVSNPRIVFNVHPNDNFLEGHKVVGRKVAFEWEGLGDVVWCLVLDALEDRPVNIF